MKRYKILFLCTGNSARSILGEYLLHQLAPDRFETFSAGARPVGAINPLVQKVLQHHFQLDTADARSKSWSEFKDVDFDFVITVCDHAKESCPVWPGQPVIAHWGLPDPASLEGTEEARLKRTFEIALEMQRRLRLFIALPLEKMDKLKWQQAVQEIGD